MSRTIVEFPEINSRTIVLWDASALSEPDATLRGQRVLLWSGSYAQLDGGNLMDEDPRTWGPKGWTAIEAACRRWTDAGVQLCLRPHASHIVSDPIGCKRLLDAQWSRGIDLLYDPLSMLAESMRGERVIQDHLRRIYEAIAGLPAERLIAVIRPKTSLISPDFIVELEDANLPETLSVAVFPE